ncbi:MAG TPA: hypothetical protein PLP65_01010 [Bacteroidales bacterium]|nr:hypothetical protein [Bacteroidales bacterium]
MRILPILFVLLLNSCVAQHKDKTNQWIQLSDNNCKIDEYSWIVQNTNPIIYRKLSISSTDTFLIINYKSSNILYFLNLNRNKAIDSLKMPFHNIHDIYTVEMINKDTIIIFFSKWDYFGNDTFYLVSLNKEGKLIKKYSLNLDFTNGKDYFIPNVYNIEFKNKKMAYIYLPRKRKLISQSKFIVIYDLKKDSSYYLPIKYPNIDNNIDAEYIFPNILWIDSNNILVSFRFNSTFLKFNLKENKIDSFQTIINEIDTNLIYSNDNSIFKGLYSIICPLRKLNIYKRYITLGNYYGKKRMELYYDSNFNLIGKKIGITPWGEECGIMYSLNQSNNKIILKIIDSLKITKYNDLEFNKQLDSLKNEYYNRYCSISIASNEEKMQNLVVKIGSVIKKENYNLLIISNSGCASCNEDVYKWLITNQSYISKREDKLYVLLLDTNNIIYININEFINRSKFIIDKNSDNEIYFNKTMNINPLIISVRNNLLKEIVHYDKNRTKFFKLLSK